MATYPTSISRLVQPNGPQLKQQDNPRLKAIKRRLQSRAGVNKKKIAEPRLRLR